MTTTSLNQTRSSPIVTLPKGSLNYSEKNLLWQKIASIVTLIFISIAFFSPSLYLDLGLPFIATLIIGGTALIVAIAFGVILYKKSKETRTIELYKDTISKANSIKNLLIDNRILRQICTSGRYGTQEILDSLDKCIGKAAVLRYQRLGYEKESLEDFSEGLQDVKFNLERLLLFIRNHHQTAAATLTSPSDLKALTIQEYEVSRGIQNAISSIENLSKEVSQLLAFF